VIHAGYFSPMNAHLARAETTDGVARWLVLFHQLPARPHYLRVRVGRRLRALGAVSAKNSVYILPDAPHFRRLLGELAREIQTLGGHAVVCEARFVAGLSDASAEDLFRDAHEGEYLAIAADAGGLAAALRARRRVTEAQRRAIGRRLARLRERFADLVGKDRFAAAGRDRAAGQLSLAEDRLAGVDDGAKAARDPAEPPRGATWITRAGVMVDRVASAWLIRRFIDRDARFRFVTGRAPKPARGEPRFDMAGAEFTHVGDRCTFEVLLERFSLRDSALRAIAEMVHDLDFEDARFKRPETSGLGRMIVGMALATTDDTERLLRGASMFDGLYESFKKQAR
jgi:hypothetical protein